MLLAFSASASNPHPEQAVIHLRPAVHYLFISACYPESDRSRSPWPCPFLHASSRGVNKDVQFPSNEYWDPALRPKLMIWCTQ